jgi:hypothetical protein
MTDFALAAAWGGLGRQRILDRRPGIQAGQRQGSESAEGIGDKLAPVARQTYMFSHGDYST